MGVFLSERLRKKTTIGDRRSSALCSVYIFPSSTSVFKMYASAPKRSIDQHLDDDMTSTTRGAFQGAIVVRVHIST